jgi:arylsulfatase A-like enzyme
MRIATSGRVNAALIITDGRGASVRSITSPMMRVELLDWQRDNKPLKEEGHADRPCWVLMRSNFVNSYDQKKRAVLCIWRLRLQHAPYQAPARYVDRFKNIQDETRRTYAGMVSCLDDQIGEVIKALEKKGMMDNTLIVFHSDNGGTRDARLTGEGTVKTVPCE